MTTTADAPETTVAEALEARTRQVMAARSRLPQTWEYRSERAAMIGEVDLLLDRLAELSG